MIQDLAASEPMLIKGLWAIGSGLFLWHAHTLISVRDMARDMHQALFDLPDANPRLGIIARVGRNEVRISTVETRIGYMEQRDRV